LTQFKEFYIFTFEAQENYDLSGVTFDVVDILGASAPVEFNDLGFVDGEIKGNRRKAPMDSGMISFWNDAIEKYKLEGMHSVEGLKR
jgi:hypothetical protein